MDSRGRSYNEFLRKASFTSENRSPSETDGARARITPASARSSTATCFPTAESYLQESGRAGCDGEPAQAIVLASPREMARPAGTPGAAASTARTAPVPWHPALEPVFGLLGRWHREEIEEALDELRVTGRLRVVRRGPWRGRITTRPSGRLDGT